MKDFTIKKYKELLNSLIEENYSFQTFDDFIKDPKEKSVVLRHDVDVLPNNSLEFARIQNKNNIKAVYYFRTVPQSYDEKIISEISALGHEIGYHYECLTTCNGDFEKGIKDFEKNLKALRELAPVTTICMHGSPLSKYDSKNLWKKYNYKDFGIIGEPYFDVNFNKVFYLTDTGRRWDGDNVSVRDRVNSVFKRKFHFTDEIIDAVDQKLLPEQIMFTFHPQRWTDNKLWWTRDVVVQIFKNSLKRVFLVKKEE